MADKVLKLDASHADWLAFAAAQWAMQDAGEEFAAGYKNTSEMIEIDVAVAKLGDAATMIREVRQHRRTVHLACARAIAITASDNTIRYLGNRHMQVLRAKGHDQVDAERQRDQQANEALMGISIIEAIDALEGGDADANDVASKRAVRAMYALADDVEADESIREDRRSHVATEIKDLATRLDEDTFRPRPGAAACGEGDR